MSKALKLRNIVLVGNFVPSTFDKYYFIKNNILSESDFRPTYYVLTSELVQINHQRFQIVVTPGQLVVTTVIEDSSDEISDVVNKFLKTDSLNQVTAMGINFHWVVLDSAKTIEELSRGYFYNDRVKMLDEYFPNADTKYGIYVSGDFKDSRLKLDIKPVSIQELTSKNEPIKSDVLLFQFNFHFDKVGTSKYLDVYSHIKNYKEYKDRSTQIINIYE